MSLDKDGCGLVVGVLSLIVTSVGVGIAYGQWFHPQPPKGENTVSTTPAPSVPTTPTPSVPTTPASALPSPDTISGTWVGSYTCGAGLTEAIVTITQNGSSVQAELLLSDHPDNPGEPIPDGAILYRGIFNSDDLTLRLPKGEWIKKPAANWEPYGFSGEFDRDLQDFFGTMNGHSCGNIRLSKDDDE